jgi:glutathione S-transferase
MVHRLRVEHAPKILLIALPLIVAATGAGVALTASGLFVIFVLRTTLRFKSLRGKDTYILETLAVSHFNEYVRWTLDRLGAPYETEDHVGIIGFLFDARFKPTLRIPKYQTSIANSSDIVSFLYGRHVSDPRAAFMAPAIEFEDVDLLRTLLETHAVHVRRIVYYWLLVNPAGSAVPGDELVRRAWGQYQPGVPVWQKLVLRALLPLCQASLVKLLRIDQRSFDLSASCVNVTFDLIDKRLADGRKFLIKDAAEPSLLDIAFAALTAPLFLPSRYGGDKAIAPESRIHLRDMPVGYQRDARKWLAQPAGKFVAMMYEEER